MSLKQKQQKSLKDKWSLRFLTTHPHGDNYDGIVVHIGSDYIVLREETDFEFDGLIALPTKYLDGYRDGPFERSRNAILRLQRAEPRLRVPRWLRACDTLPALLARLQEREIWPAVEVLTDQGKSCAVYLGALQEVAESGVVLKGYDAAGKWEKPTHIDFDEVFRVEFDSRYCNHFNAYMKNKVTAASRRVRGGKRKTTR